MDVGVWLRGLGLGQYEAAFRENEIGGDVLPNLTADDLKELGVTVVGHRRKLLTAIGSLGGPLPTSDMTATAPPPPACRVPDIAVHRRTARQCERPARPAPAISPPSLADALMHSGLFGLHG